MGKRKLNTTQAPSLDGINHTVIDRFTALVAVTSQEEGQPLLLVAERIHEEVQACIDKMKVSVSEINRCIKRWVNLGWARLVKGQHVVTKKGINCLHLLAEAATVKPA